VDEWETTNPDQIVLIRGGWPSHEITKKLCAPFIHSFIVDEWETTNPDQIVLIRGGWPSHEITKKLCAPFIHSFIVDEWETTNPDQIVLIRGRVPHLSSFSSEGWDRTLARAVRCGILTPASLTADMFRKPTA
jgi:hypothetical protein